MMELSAVLRPVVEGGYVAFNPETGKTTQGEAVEEALANLREATELYLEEFPLTITPKNVAISTTFRHSSHPFVIPATFRHFKSSQQCPIVQKKRLSSVVIFPLLSYIHGKTR